MLQELLVKNLDELRREDLKKIHVAVLDTGIDSSHDALQGKVIKSIGFKKDSNGNICSYRLPADRNNDPSGHGTATASIIASLAPNAVFTDYRVLTADNCGSGRTILKALQMAIDSNVDIINLSLTVTKNTYWDDMVKLLEQAYLRRKIVVAAKRNIPMPQDMGLPAELSSCLSVDNQALKSPFMFRFLNNSPIDFSANGMGVMAAKNGGGYHRVSGTSFATPTMTAMTALLLGKKPDLYLFEIKTLLKYHQNPKRLPEVNPLEYMPVMSGATAFAVSCRCKKCGKKFLTNDLYSVYLCRSCGTAGIRQPLLDGQLYNFAISILSKNIAPEYTFHNIRHTDDVLSAVYELFTKKLQLSREQKKILLAAALFHDFGYLESRTDHERFSAEIAGQLLRDFNWQPQRIGSVQKLILATRPEHIPENLSEKIIADADLYHIGTERYLAHSQKLRKELQNFGKKFTRRQWLKNELKFLASHQFQLPFLHKERQMYIKMMIEQIQHELDKKIDKNKH